MTRHGPVIRLTQEEIRNLKPNEPTPRRVFGTDASLTWEEQREQGRKNNSMVMSRLATMIETSTENNIAELTSALSRAMAIAKTGDKQDQEPALTDEQLARHIKK